jgi:putative peptide zinc metalloprotease protein
MVDTPTILREGEAPSGFPSPPLPHAPDPAPLPERPARAPDVRLVGPMPGTSFEQQQWLAQRGAHFIQLTELLYCVLEQADGTRTLPEIAAAVTDATDWAVTEENVQQLIQAKLAPLGLMAGADGLAMSRDGAGSAGGASSALNVNMHMKMIGPRFLDPVTRVLQVLFAPALLIPLLVVVAVAHAWLYLTHMRSVVQGVLDVLYTPALALPVVALVLAAAVFHEFGHASALRYGGGQVRGMGVGFYLAYPAFYTDVTDSYRLGRGARVRTDLGGVYFHLLFAGALLALALISGQPYLLLCVVLIDTEVLRQFIPFVRLDGYWVLADLTGIPDFFSQMGPFLRSVLPGRAGAGSKLPDLKPVAKVTFAAFIVLTIPVLLAGLALLVLGVPALLGTTWDSLGAQIDGLGEALGQGSVVYTALGVLQILVLALPVLGTAYLLLSLSISAGRGLWGWSRPSARRRVAAALLTVAVPAVVAAIWAPQLVVLASGGPPGVQEYTVTQRTHVDGRVSYPQTPPVGGNHSPVWQNCGFYDTPIANENGVHSMEHGAVWITYQPDLRLSQVALLHDLARGQDYILVSPYPGLRAPVVASAWGRQIDLTGADDPRLTRFIEKYKQSAQAPERGGPCTGGRGDPK